MQGKKKRTKRDCYQQWAAGPTAPRRPARTQQATGATRSAENQFQALAVSDSDASLDQLRTYIQSILSYHPDGLKLSDLPQQLGKAMNKEFNHRDYGGKTLKKLLEKHLSDIVTVEEHNGNCVASLILPLDEDETPEQTSIERFIILTDHEMEVGDDYSFGFFECRSGDEVTVLGPGVAPNTLIVCVGPHTFEVPEVCIGSDFIC